MPKAESSDGSSQDLPGGLVPVTLAQLDEFSTGACVQPLHLDGGVRSLAAIDGGACTYPLLWPNVAVEIPDGCTATERTIDPSMVSVVWIRDGDQPLYVGQSAPNCAHSDGWYPGNAWGSTAGYSIVLCAATCAAVSSDTRGHIDIYVGCVGPGIIC